MTDYAFTIRVTDAISRLAYSPQILTLIARDQYWANYVSLLHFDGADGSTTFTDQSGKTWTASGNAQIDTSDSKFGGASLLLDGVGDYLTGPDSNDWNFGSDNFTFECFLKLDVAEDAHIFSQITNTSLDTNRIMVGYWSGVWNFYSRGGSTPQINANVADTPPTGVWFHFAVSREGSNIRFFRDGILIGTVVESMASFDLTGPSYIGLGRTGGAVKYFKGRIDDLRITKGEAIYTTNFAIPTSAYPNGRTVSLLHFDGTDGATTFTDQKTKTWTATGNAQIDTAQSKFGGASLLLDGTGDYISTPNHADFNIENSDYTIETFVRIAVTGIAQTIFSKRSTTANANEYQLSITDTNKLQFIGWDSAGTGTVISIGGASGLATLSSGVFYHIAVTRSGTTWRLFVNGVVDSSGIESANIPAKTFAPTIGRDGSSTPRYLNGNIDELRVTKGVARYTGDFTVPTIAFPDV